MAAVDGEWTVVAPAGLGGVRTAKPACGQHEVVQTPAWDQPAALEAPPGVAAPGADVTSERSPAQCGARDLP